MVEENPKMLLHDRAIKYARNLATEAQSDRQSLGHLRVIVSYGETGTGKTFSAINFVARDQAYYKLSAPSLKGGKLWFDGYEGQKVLIMDDWDGQCCSAATMKNLLDVYKLQVEIKGGTAWACWHTVVITSNLHPRDWYIRMNENQDQTEIRPLRRRITEIRHYLSENIYQLETWDGEPQGDQVEEPHLDMIRPGLIDRAPTPDPDADHITDIAEAPTPRLNLS